MYVHLFTLENSKNYYEYRSLRKKESHINGIWLLLYQKRLSKVLLEKDEIWNTIH